MIETTAMKTLLDNQGNRIVAGIPGKIASSGMGMVNETDVMVITPAKK
jgi:hypothetical protein